MSSFDAGGQRRGPAPIRVVVADPHRVVAEAVADRLQREADLDVAGTAGTVSDLLALAERSRPDVLLSEAAFGDGLALDAAAEMRRLAVSARVVLLTAAPADSLLEQAVRLGVGYVLKTEPMAAVIGSVRRAAAGETPYSDAVVGRLRFDPAEGRHVLNSASRVAGLTARQVEVLRWIALGRSGREIAAGLGLTEKAVESHKYRIMNRLGVRDRVALARLAIREGLLTA